MVFLFLLDLWENHSNQLINTNAIKEELLELSEKLVDIDIQLNSLKKLSPILDQKEESLSKEITLINSKIITFVTDIEHPIKNPVESTIELARNSDILIHEAHFSPEDLAKHKDWGHCSWEEAVIVAKAAKVK